MFATYFRAFLLAEPTIASLVVDHVHVGNVLQDVDPPYIYIQRAGTGHERTLDQAQGTWPFEERWDLECISDDPDELQSLADSVRRLDSARGAFGVGGSIQGLFVEDQQDDYVPKGVNSDEGLDVAAFQITVYGYEPGT